MNLIDAIKSGRPFRKVDTGVWYRVTSDGIDAYRVDDESRVIFTVADVTGDIWEIQEPSVTITRTQFWEAVLPIIGSGTYLQEVFDGVARHLGLSQENA